MTIQTKTQPKRFLRLPQVQEYIPLSTSEIYRRIDAGTFPKPIRLGARAVGWLESDINNWIDQQLTNHKKEAANDLEPVEKRNPVLKEF